jgi:hypothetical protein
MPVSTIPSAGLTVPLTTATVTTLTSTTISDGTNSTSATNVIQGSAKAWVNFNGSTGTIRTSLNVTSVTRTTTGTYTINFTTGTFADANYSWTGMAAAAAGGGSIPYNLPSIGQRTYAPTASTLQVATAYQQGGSASDFDYVYVQVFR